MVHEYSGRLVEVNTLTCTLLGYSREELLHMNVSDLEADFDLSEAQTVWGGITPRQPITVMGHKRRKDGSVFSVEDRLGCFDLAGQRYYLGMSRDVSDRIKAEKSIRNYSNRLRRLSRRTMELEEDERRRLGRELHDRIGANLSALLMNQEVLRKKFSPDMLQEFGPRLDDCESLLRETMRQVREILAELRPAALDELGLLAALNHHGQLVARRHGIDIRIEGAEFSPRLPPGVEISLFRIAQEALNNVVKHAKAEHVTILFFQRAGLAALAVADDGAGFDPTPVEPGAASLGMLTMRERAEAIGAFFNVQSAPGEGTRVTVEVPMTRPTA